MTLFERVYSLLYKQLLPAYANVFGNYDEEGYPIEDDAWEDDDAEDSNDYDDDGFYTEDAPVDLA